MDSHLATVEFENGRTVDAITGLPIFVDEPLALSAPLAARLADSVCWRDSATGDGCVAYHRLWQYLRLLGVTTTLRTNAQFIVEHISRLARTGNFNRVLISGSADYSMLAHVLQAFFEAGQEPNVTMVDRCPTPLLINRWYARRIGVRIAVTRTEIQKFEAEQPFDLICTHNFLAFFAADERERVMRSWARALRPGGAIVTTVRVRPDEPVKRPKLTPSEVGEFADRVEQAAMHHRERFSAVEVRRLRVWATEYAKNSSYAYGIQSWSEIDELFADNGMDIVCLEPESIQLQRLNRFARLPVTRQPRQQIVAIRRT